MTALGVSYVESYNLRDAKDVHPSHRVAVIEVTDLLYHIYNARDKGNLVGENGFSSAIFLSTLIKKLEGVKND